MEQQLDLFEQLDIRTALIPAEEQKAGRRGWIINFAPVRDLGSEDVKCIHVNTEPVVFVDDTRDGDQHCRSTHGPYHGWWGGARRVWAGRPTWKECCEYVKEKSMYWKPGMEILYYEVGNHDEVITDYEKGYRRA